MLRRIGCGIPASAPLAKAAVEWAQPHAGWLFGASVDAPDELTWDMVLTGVAQTAIGRVAQGSNTGARAGYPGSYGDKFGIDMPIIDANNNPDKPLGSPGNSWLMYKLLLATPLTSETTPLSATDCKGGTVPFTKEPLPAVETTAPGDDERARLSDYVLGNQMPYPPNPGTDNTQSNLTVDELERVQTWIAQGAVVDDCSVCIPPTK